MPTTDNLTTTVAKVRKHYSAVRAMKRNCRLRRYQGRNSTYTTDVMVYREREGDELLATLPRQLQGLLTQEHKLAARISENRDAGQDRPELRDRMNRLRRNLKALLKTGEPDAVTAAVARLEASAAAEQTDPDNWTTDPCARFDEDGRLS